ncbi:MAG: carboxymuconolactone decarboxylase family protein [Pseudomonadota bacterium]
MSIDRKERGRELARRYFGREITPDQEDDPFFVPALEHLFGEIWTREGLSLRDRALVTISSLVALGRNRELGIHLHGAMNVGVTQDEIQEMIVHLGYYGGFPTAASGREVFKKVLEARRGDHPS